MKICYLLLFTLALSGCSKINYFEGEPSAFDGTRVLGHRGGGSDGDFPENTLLATEEGFQILDGVEIDVQISLDGTVWLAHDVAELSCSQFSFDCFPEVSDSALFMVDSCSDVPFSYARLEEVFALVDSLYPEKFISIDVKSWFPCGFSSVNVVSKLNELGNEIIRLSNAYNLNGRVMIESEIDSFLRNVRQNSTGIETYFLALGSFDSALEHVLTEGHHGISFKYQSNDPPSIEDISLLHDNGLKIQLWTINDQNDIEAALSIQPDFIQTDNLDYFSDESVNEE